MRQSPLFLKMAVRNALKYRRRTLQTGLAIFLGVSLVALGDAYLAGFSARTIDGFIAEGGHLTVSAPGYAAREEMMPLDKAVPESEAAARELRSAAPSLRVYPSIRLAGLVSKAGSSDRSATALCRGIQPRDGGVLSPAYGGVSRRTARGRFLETGRRGMAMSEKLASKLGAAPGDRVVLVCSDRFGGFGAGEFELAGTFADGSSFGGEGCFIDLEGAREISGIESGATELKVYAMDAALSRVLDPREAGAAIAAAAARADRLGLEATTWDKASGSIASTLEFLDVFMYVMYGLFAVVAVVGIANSALLSVQDRIRDFGTLRAIAFTRDQVSLMIVSETLFVGAAAAALAVAVAGGAVACLQSGSFVLPKDISGVAGWMPREIKPLLAPARLLVVFAAGALAPPLAALYPIGMIRRMSVREALGHV